MINQLPINVYYDLTEPHKHSSDTEGDLVMLCNEHALQLLAIHEVQWASRGDEESSCELCGGNRRRYEVHAIIAPDVPDRNNLATADEARTLAHDEGSIMEYVINPGVCSYFRYRQGWQTCIAARQNEGHWTLSEWRLMLGNPHKLQHPIVHQSNTTPGTVCTCGFTW